MLHIYYDFWMLQLHLVQSNEKLILPVRWLAKFYFLTFLQENVCFDSCDCNPRLRHPSENNTFSSK